ncbi:MAG: M20/M25/M40 family metallo-hydrolase [Isosphaeraceae bacterium]|nr:M20/M25/M40 family metallo-hydrolase [Isosphaeraceae bacterium]
MKMHKHERVQESAEPHARPRLKRVGRIVGIVLAAVLGAGAVFAGYLVVCAWGFTPSRQVVVEKVEPIAPRAGFAERLSRAIRFETISREEEGATNAQAFVDLAKYLETAFPRVHAACEREILEGGTILFRLPSKEPAAAPVLLMSHLDVVPVEKATETGWTHPPFSGAIADGFIWGRGALDVKAGALGLLEAAEALLESGFVPRCDIYFAFGHDEELGGTAGNARLARMLAERGVRFRFVLDEGGTIAEGILSGIDRPIAFVGIAEKGLATIRITTHGSGGHASMPVAPSAVGILARILVDLEANPSPSKIDGALETMLDHLAPEMGGLNRLVAANHRLLGPVILAGFSQVPTLDAMTRTTTALTRLEAGEKSNVLPQTAEAFVHLRLIPGDDSAAALRRIEARVRALGFDEKAAKVAIEPGSVDPSAISAIDSAEFASLRRSISEIYPDAIVAPGLSMVATDSRHYAPISDAIYRFLPLRLTREDLSRIHGTDERIRVEDYERMIGFLARLIENLAR